MTTREEYEDASEWLNLSLPSNPSSTAQSVSDRTPKKVFSCNYCMRKFYNSQALGGHQNAHKRERGAMRRYHYSQAMMSYMNYPVNPPMAGSLGVHGYSLVSNTARERSSMVENLIESSQRGQSWRSYHLHHHIMAETVDYMWPGSFRIEQQTQGETLDHQTELDLNLKL